MGFGGPAVTDEAHVEASRHRRREMLRSGVLAEYA